MGTDVCVCVCVRVRVCVCAPGALHPGVVAAAAGGGVGPAHRQARRAPGRHGPRAVSRAHRPPSPMLTQHSMHTQRAWKQPHARAASRGPRAQPTVASYTSTAQLLPLVFLSHLEFCKRDDTTRARVRTHSGSWFSLAGHIFRPRRAVTTGLFYVSPDARTAGPAAGAGCEKCALV